MFAVKLPVVVVPDVYGIVETERLPITEEHPLRGQSPYAATKIGADQLAMSFHDSFDKMAAILSEPERFRGDVEPVESRDGLSPSRAQVAVVFVEPLNFGEVWRIQVRHLEPARSQVRAAGCTVRHRTCRPPASRRRRC